MGFKTIIQNTQSGVAGNQGVMEYLRKIVPRMFQNTLSLLSRQIIQQFLDELVWREWFGQSPAKAYNNMVLHLAEQTRMNVGESLIQRLNKVAANPFKNYAFMYMPSSTTQKNDQGTGNHAFATFTKYKFSYHIRSIDLNNNNRKLYVFHCSISKIISCIETE